jgi:hypothetical protein
MATEAGAWVQRGEDWDRSVSPPVPQYTGISAVPPQNVWALFSLICSTLPGHTLSPVLYTLAQRRPEIHPFMPLFIQ